MMYCTGLSLTGLAVCRSSTTAFRTTDLPNQVAGYDASRLASSAAISTWTDYFNANDATQATSADQPRNDLTTLGPDNLRVMTFDGVSDFFNLVSAVYTLPAGSNTVIGVFRAAADTAAADRLFTGTAGAGSRFFLSLGTTSAGFRSGASFGGAVADTIALNTWYIFVGQRSGTTQSISIDGKTALTNASGADAVLDGGVIGKYLSSDNSGVFSGEIAQLMFFNAALNSSDVDKAVGRMAHKYGLTASLPAGHPYKTTAP